MKRIVPLAFLLAAAPALLSAQIVTVDCPDGRCQVAPYFAGNGGFVGKWAGLGIRREVEFFVVCGNATIAGSTTPDADGIVRQVLTEDNGFSCRGGVPGRIEVDNLEPGGWYWINDDRNSAVAAFMPKGAVDNDQIEVTDPGGVVLERESDGLGTYVKHPESGRVGIIPNVVPTRQLPGCSGASGEESAGDCHLGTPASWRLSASHTTVVRPTGLAPDRQVVITLHGEKFITVRPLSARGEIDHHASVAAIRFTGDGGQPTERGEAGVLKWLVTVGTDDNRCLAANNDPDRGSPQVITFTLSAMDGAIPTMPEDGLERSFRVICPADSAAGASAELVPENPFPVD